MLYLLALLPALAAASPVAKRYTGQWIVNGPYGSCLTLPAGTAPGNGALLIDGPCDPTTTLWDINPGSGSVVISGTNFALDAGSNPANGVQAKVWTSYPGLSQQTWYLTGDNRIAITGGTQCLDVGLPNPGYPQTWQCTPGNTNQVWNVVTPGGSGPSSSSSTATPTSMPSSSASSTTSASASKTTSSMAPHATTTLRTQRQLQWGGPGNGCLTVQGGQAYNGVPVNIGTCQFPDDNGARPQWFNYADGGAIQWYADTTYCLDAGSNPSNGGQLKLWQCYAGLPQQTWNFGSGTLFQTANNQCIDVNNSGNTMLQTWTCSATDPQQQFYIV